jgi:Domain of unknown function (DUF4845)
MTRQPGSRRTRQGGFSLIGLLFWAVVIGFLGYVAVRVVPTVNEYMTIQGLVNKVAAAPPATVPEIRAAFDRYREVEYAVKAVTGKDLDISKEGNRVVIAFAYEKEVPLGGPAYLLLKYQGRSK